MSLDLEPTTIVLVKLFIFCLKKIFTYYLITVFLFQILKEYLI